MNKDVIATLSGIGKYLAVVEGNLEFGVLAVEIVLQAVEVAAAFPLAHGQVVKQAVAAGFGCGSGHFGLSENPLEALDGEAAHVFDGIAACHDDIHARKASHGTNVHHIVLCLAIAEPGGHEVLKAVHSCGCYGWFFVGFRDAEVEGGESPVDARHIDAGLQVGVVDGETLNYFHCL